MSSFFSSLDLKSRGIEILLSLVISLAGLSTLLPKIVEGVSIFMYIENHAASRFFFLLYIILPLATITFLLTTNFGKDKDDISTGVIFFILKLIPIGLILDASNEISGELYRNPFLSYLILLYYVIIFGGQVWCFLKKNTNSDKTLTLPQRVKIKTTLLTLVTGLGVLFIFNPYIVNQYEVNQYEYLLVALLYGILGLLWVVLVLSYKGYALKEYLPNIFLYIFIAILLVLIAPRWINFLPSEKFKLEDSFFVFLVILGLYVTLLYCFNIGIPLITKIMKDSEGDSADKKKKRDYGQYFKKILSTILLGGILIVLGTVHWWKDSAWWIYLGAFVLYPVLFYYCFKRKKKSWEDKKYKQYSRALNWGGVMIGVGIFGFWIYHTHNEKLSGKIVSSYCELQDLTESKHGNYFDGLKIKSFYALKEYCDKCEKEPNKTFVPSKLLINKLSRFHTNIYKRANLKIDDTYFVKHITDRYDEYLKEYQGYLSKARDMEQKSREILVLTVASRLHRPLVTEKGKITYASNRSKFGDIYYNRHILAKVKEVRKKLADEQREDDKNEWLYSRTLTEGNLSFTEAKRLVRKHEVFTKFRENQLIERRKKGKKLGQIYTQMLQRRVATILGYAFVILTAILVEVHLQNKKEYDTNSWQIHDPDKGNLSNYKSALLTTWFILLILFVKMVQPIKLSDIKLDHPYWSLNIANWNLLPSETNPYDDMPGTINDEEDTGRKKENGGNPDTRLANIENLLEKLGQPDEEFDGQIERMDQGINSLEDIEGRYEYERNSLARKQRKRTATIVSALNLH